MSAAVCRIGFLCLLSVVIVAEVGGKSLKIVIPREISHIHHHHPGMGGMKFRKRFPPNDIGVGEQPHEEEESREYQSDEEFDGAEENDVYYTPPGRGFCSNGVPKPVNLYSNGYRGRIPPLRNRHVVHKDLLERRKLPGHHLKVFSF